MSDAPSIAMCCNVYNDATAIRGLLETSSRFFDNLFVVHSGPGGAYSTDGTIEICQQFGATVVFDDIQRGFGAIRSRLIHDCGCAWAFILDADERFYPVQNVIDCEGTEWYPQIPNPNLTVIHKSDMIDQGLHLRNLTRDPGYMAVQTTRRHWFGFSMKKAAQNFKLNRDNQLRIVRNLPEIGYQSNVVMHEQLIDSRTGGTPHFAGQDDYHGPFHDHFHLHFRTTQPGQKEFNEQNYLRLERGEPMTIK